MLSYLTLAKTSTKTMTTSTSAMTTASAQAAAQAAALLLLKLLLCCCSAAAPSPGCCSCAQCCTCCHQSSRMPLPTTSLSCPRRPSRRSGSTAPVRRNKGRHATKWDITSAQHITMTTQILKQAKSKQHPTKRAIAQQTLGGKSGRNKSCGRKEVQ